MLKKPMQPQNTTNANSGPVTASLNVAANEKPLTTQQRLFIDFRAIGGYITDADAAVPKKQTMQWFANYVGIRRETLYDWQKNIPDFWGKVNQRRKEIGSQERLAKIHDTWYLKALSGSFPHLQLWLANFDPDFKMPTQKAEIDTGQGLADLVQLVRQKQQRERNVIDGEVTSTNNA